MFHDYIFLTYLNIKFNNSNTKKVIDMSHMFYNCYSLISINLKSFDFSNFITLKGMFEGCDKLVYLNIDNLISLHVSDMSYMLNECKSLISLIYIILLLQILNICFMNVIL